MGTKANPGEFDCYAKAGADEPIFTVRAKDPHAAMLVRMWAQSRLALIAAKEKPQEDYEAVKEAHAVADAMDEWHNEHVRRPAEDAALRAHATIKPPWNEPPTDTEKAEQHQLNEQNKVG